MPTKKLINEGQEAVDEMLSGFLAAHSELVFALPGTPRAILAQKNLHTEKVVLIIGGGSGHEPTFLGFVGRGFADAAIIGNVFASPPPGPIIEAVKHVHAGAGAIFIYGNYAGDAMNFDMAAEMLAADSIDVRTVVTTDDIASAPISEINKRRGVAGNFFVFKIAGAACDLLWSLDEVERVAKKANARTRTLGVALEPCSLPDTLRHNFDIDTDEIEFGMGIHGEPGIRREKMRPADEITDEIVDLILKELGPEKGDRFAVLVNSLGATPSMELYIIYRRVAERFDAAGLTIRDRWVGPFCTSLEMAGASISIIHLDDELERLIDHPCRSAALSQ